MKRHLDSCEYKQWEGFYDFYAQVEDRSAHEVWSACTRGDQMLWLLGCKSGETGWPDRKRLVGVGLKVLDAVQAKYGDCAGMLSATRSASELWLRGADKPGIRETAIRALDMSFASDKSGDEEEGRILFLASCVAGIAYAVRPPVLSVRIGTKAMELFGEYSAPKSIVADIVRSAVPSIPKGGR